MLIDYLLRQLRFRIAAKHVKRNAIVLDYGCGQGQFFKYLTKRGKLGYGYGIDPVHKATKYVGNYILSAHNLPYKVNTVVMLASIEHFGDLNNVKKEIDATLDAGGRVIITLPDPKVDKVLKVFGWLLNDKTWRQHTGLTMWKVLELFEDYKLVAYGHFEFGFNHLLVFEKK